jgi:hypothetical protein
MLASIVAAPLAAGMALSPSILTTMRGEDFTNLNLRGVGLDRFVRTNF